MARETMGVWCGVSWEGGDVRGTYGVGIEEEYLHARYLVYEAGEVGLYCFNDVHLGWRRGGKLKE